MRSPARLAVTLLVALLIHTSAAAAQVPGQTGSGATLFDAYCAPCHGTDGKGKGSISGALKTPPPDLSTLTARHGGRYPRARVERFVTDGTGTLAPAHAVKVMPKWGPTLSSFDPSIARVKGNIAAIVSHLETLQTEVVIASGTLVHHALTDDLFHIGTLWIRGTPGTEYYRWLSAGTGHQATLTLAVDPSRFADARNTRILPGTLRHNEAPSAWPIVHVLFFTDDETGAISPLTVETNDEAAARLFGRRDNVVSSLVVQIKQ